MQIKKIILPLILWTLALCLTHSALAQEFIFEPSPSLDLEIVSIDMIISQAHDISVGNIEEIELKKRNNRWIYEVEILTSDNNKLELIFDARDGALLFKRHVKHKWRMSR
jgi:uncharacterized membrane protein YkoI